MRLLLERGVISISELRSILKSSTSSLYYDIEILRINGLVMKLDGSLRITERGRAVMERMSALFHEGRRGGELWGKLAAALLLKPLVVYMLRLGPNTLLLYSVLIIIMGASIALMRNYGMVLLLYLQSLPTYTVTLSLLAYMGISLAIHKYALKGSYVDSRVMGAITASLIPTTLYPGLTLLTELLSPLMQYVINLALELIMTILSLIILATAMALTTGKPIEYVFLIETLTLLLPSGVSYIILTMQ